MNWTASTGVLAVVTICVCACEPGQGQTEERVREIAEEVIPQIERVVGLQFDSAPRIAVRSSEQIQQYIDTKIETELPPDELERMSVAYRLLGMLPDTLDLRSLLSELYYEQVVGYYEPDSATLFIPEGTDRSLLRLTVGHELVHAPQDQHMPLAEILSLERENDRLVAAQAILEGQATLVSMLDMLPDNSLSSLDEVWAQLRETIQEQQTQMPVLGSAPRLIREGLVFPYLEGAEFVRWFMRANPDTVPYGPRMPESTEQILHPDRYRLGDEPVDLAFTDSLGVLYDDVLGELEIRIFLTELTGSETVGAAAALRWAGDRYAVLEAGRDSAIVWWSVWDNQTAAARFAQVIDREWPGRVSATERYDVELTEVEGIPGVLFMFGPLEWDRWNDPPRVSVRRRTPGMDSN
ncbi:MAG: hypothetical protein P8X82_17255 [Gemmatimonadales bacterium]